MNLNIYGRLLFSFLSGIILYFAWPTNDFYPIIFIGFIPLLFALRALVKLNARLKYIQAFLLTFLTFFIWTSLALLWLYKTASDSHLLVVIFTSLNYSLFLAFFPLVYNKIGQTVAVIYFASAILFVDWISQIFLLSTPYFNLGLGLGKAPWLIQHYKWIGIEGGSLWIILVNLLLFRMIVNKSYKLKKQVPLLFVAVIIPIISLITYNIPESSDKNTNAIIHHANFNPATEETFETPTKIIDQLFEATFNNLEKEPTLVVWPETVVIRLGWLHRLDTEPVVQHIKSKLKNYPNTTLVFGAIGFSHAQNKKEITEYTTYVPEGNYYYNTHNVAVTVRANLPTTIKSKEMFIPFHERIPYVETLPFMKKLVKTIGRKVMFNKYEKGNQLTEDINGNRYVSVLCYESLFSIFMIKKSSEKIGAILVHANEHWLKDINGSEQYLYKNVPIAIQAGKPLLRSSNCGVSSLITSKGDIITPTNEKTSKNIACNLNLNYQPTVYYYISGIIYKLSGIVLLLVIILLIRKS